MRLPDTALAVLASARLSRLVVTDDLGKWWVKDPIDYAMASYARNEVHAADREKRDAVTPGWWKYRSGLDCPWCVGFWLGAATLTVGAIASRRPGPARALWRLCAGALALNYVTAHAGIALGDFDTDDEETDDR